MKKKPSPKTGAARVRAAFGYSVSGLKYAVGNEAAFRQEVFLTAVLLIVMLFLPLSYAWKGLLFFATVQVLVVELLNSAVEAVVDMASPDFHDLAGRAKDMGSAAVLISLTIAGALWIISLL